MRSFRFGMFVVLFLCMMGFGPLYAARVVVVKSDALASYNEAVTAFTMQSPDTLSEYNLAKNPATGRKIFAQLAAQPPDLILSVGPLATSLAKELIKTTPILFLMVPDNQAESLRADTITGISLYVPALAQLSALKELSPTITRVGIVHSAEEASPSFDTARQAAKKLGVVLVFARVSAEDRMAAALEGLKGKIDALWLLPDDVVLSPTAHEALVAYSLREHLPFMTLTPRLVKAGALVSLSADFAALGRQAAALANKILRDNGKPATLPIVAPEGLNLAFNLGTAKIIGQEKDIGLRLLSIAATQALPLVIYK